MNSDLIDLLFKYNFMAASAAGAVLGFLLGIVIYFCKRPTMLGTCFLLTVLTAQLYLDKQLLFPQGSGYHNLVIATLTIYGVIVFALLISIIESARSSESKDTMRVLLWSSCIYPLSVVEIFMAMNLFQEEFGAVTFLILWLLGGLMIFSIYQVVNILIQRSLFLKKRAELIVGLLIELSKRSKLGDENSSKLLEEETASLKDDAEMHIRNGSIFFVREYAKLYGQIVYGLSKKNNNLNHPQNDSNLKPWQWLKSDLESIFNTALSVGNPHIIRELTYLPIQFAYRPEYRHKDIQLAEACFDLIPQARSSQNYWLFHA
tara:strand:- start:2797 stop:3750 length:954 start_codon:yes stop_codon:yes gene_type:complete